MLLLWQSRVKAEEGLHSFDVSYEKTKIIGFGRTLSVEDTADMMCFAGTVKYVDRCS